ncbi:hypothetical protein GOBAR_DD28813 [Gossypium barbadense]|nr:hypothetical protein GOBAR_DD28813 [Gossypium barbadense]
MFYSHTFLSRKAPLGTVWTAAHLQHRLKKSHYASIDILSTVDINASDNHLKSPEDITLTDQILVERDAYVAITFDDDIMMDDALPQMNDGPHEPPESGHEGFEDPGPDNQEQVPSVQNAGPSNQTQVLESVSNEGSQDLLEIEMMRDASHDFSTQKLPSMCPDDKNIDALEQALDEKEICSPSLNLLASGELSMPFQQHSNPPTSASNGPPEAFVHESPELVIPPSPPPPQPRQRRKTRQKFDEKLVLPNRFMKRALEDCSDLVRKKKKIPCSALGVWKSNNDRKMDQVFNEPSLTGLSEDICNMFKRDGISIKSQLVVPEEIVPEPMLPQSTVPTTEASSELRVGPATPDPRAGLYPGSAPGMDMETECLRHIEGNAADNVFPEFESFPAGSMASPFRREDTPFSARSLESEWAPTAGTASTTNFAASTATRWSDIDTPRTFMEEQSCLGNSGFSTIPEFETSETFSILVHLACLDGVLPKNIRIVLQDLYFLEEDANTPTESAASQGVGSLSARTRAVAKYLKSHSPITPIPEDGHIDLSLNKILEGKTRKICARMFFETVVVLKSYGMIDVRQEEAYGDITLQLNPSMLSKVDPSKSV